MLDPCLGCELISGVASVPGGFVCETKHWVVNHCVGPLGLGTLMVAPRRHVVRVSDLSDEEATELGPLTRRTASVIDEILGPEQVYVCLWSHGAHGPKHLHWVVQPVTSELMHRHGGKRSEELQLAMFEADEYPRQSEVETFCARARQDFAA